MRDINAFKKYPGEIRDALAVDCGYQYLTPGRTVIKEGGEAHYLYFVAEGNLQILKNIKNEETGNCRRCIYLILY